VASAVLEAMKQSSKGIITSDMTTSKISQHVDRLSQKGASDDDIGLVFAHTLAAWSSPVAQTSDHLTTALEKLVVSRSGIIHGMARSMARERLPVPSHMIPLLATSITDSDIHDALWRDGMTVDVVPTAMRDSKTSLLVRSMTRHMGPVMWDQRHASRCWMALCHHPDFSSWLSSERQAMHLTETDGRAAYRGVRAMHLFSGLPDDVMMHTIIPVMEKAPYLVDHIIPDRSLHAVCKALLEPVGDYRHSSFHQAMSIFSTYGTSMPKTMSVVAITHGRMDLMEKLQQDHDDASVK
jgi:hypothetical protein